MNLVANVTVGRNGVRAMLANVHTGRAWAVRWGGVWGLQWHTGATRGRWRVGPLAGYWVHGCTTYLVQST